MARFMRAASLAGTVAFMAGPSLLPGQSVTVGTGAPPSGDPYAATFGTSGPLPTLAVGQSFTTPVGVGRLDAMQFWVRDVPGLIAPGDDFAQLTYRLYVAPFDGVTGRVSGAPLYVSASRAGFMDVTPRAVSFTTGGVAVLPGARYLAFLVPDEPVPPFLPLGPYHGQALGFYGDAYADGDAYALTYQAGVDPGPLAGAWNDESADLAFSATFGAVPEPGTLALVGAGLAGAATAVRVRRRRVG